MGVQSTENRDEFAPCLTIDKNRSLDSVALTSYLLLWIQGHSYLDHIE